MGGWKPGPTGIDWKKPWKFHPRKEQEKNILNGPVAMYRFNYVIVVIKSGLINGLEITSSDLRGQVVIIVALVITQTWLINDSLLQEAFS